MFPAIISFVHMPFPARKKSKCVREVEVKQCLSIYIYDYRPYILCGIGLELLAAGPDMD